MDNTPIDEDASKYLYKNFSGFLKGRAGAVPLTLRHQIES